MKQKKYEIALGMTYVLLLGLFFWFNLAGTEKAAMSSMIYSMLLFGVVFIIYIYTAIRFCKISRIAEALSSTAKKIKNQYEDGGKKLLWGEYESAEKVFQEPVLDDYFEYYQKEMKRTANDSSVHFYCDIQDYINTDVIDGIAHKNILSIFPGTMTGLGILFTFFGLTICLQSFNTGSADEIMLGIEPLMNGIKIAFHTSIYGLVFSLIYNYCYRQKLNDSYRAVDEFLDSFEECVCPNSKNDGMNQLLWYQNKQTQMVQQMSGSLSETISTSMEGVMKPQTEVARSIVEQQEKMNNVVLEFLESSSKTQLEGLNRIVKKFMADMNEAVGESFVTVKEAMQETTEAQKEYVGIIKTAVSEMKTAVAGMQKMTLNMQSSVGVMSGNVMEMKELQESIVRSMDTMEHQLIDNNNISKEQQEYYKQISEFQKQMGEAFTNWETQSKSLFETTAYQTSDFIIKTQEAVELMQKQNIDNSKAITRVGSDLSEHTRKQVESIEQQFTGWLEETGKEIVQMEERIRNAYSKQQIEVQKQMTEALQTTINNVESTVSNMQRENTEFISVTQQAIVRLQEQSENNTFVLQKAETEMTQNLHAQITQITSHFSEWMNKSQEALIRSGEELKSLQMDLANSNSNSIAIITQNVETFGINLAKQAQEQLRGIAEIKEQMSEEFLHSAEQLNKAISGVNITMSSAVKESLGTFAEELKETITELNGTIYEIRKSTGMVPNVIFDAYKSLNQALDEAENHMNNLLKAIEDLYSQVKKKQNQIGKEAEKYVTQTQAISTLVDVLQKQSEKMQEVLETQSLASTQNIKIEEELENSNQQNQKQPEQEQEETTEENTEENTDIEEATEQFSFSLDFSKNKSKEE